MLSRLITDNTIVAYEVLHSMNTKQRRHKGSMEVKLDISKTYNILEWRFLEAMMSKLGFNEVWIFRIMTCTNTVSYSILVNGQLGLVIKPTRGLHQGSLISPYLYLIYVEGLSILLNEAENAAKIRGVKVARVSYAINYFFFIDDNIIFYRGNTRE